MANIVVSLGSSNQNTAGRLVYADLALQSSPSKIQLKSIYTNEANKGYLSADNALSAYAAHSQNGYIETDPANSGEVSSGVKIAFYSNIVPTAANLAYNKQARKRAHFKLDKNVNAIAVKQALHNIFAWTPGERVLNPQFGSNLRKYLYEGLTDSNKELIMAEIRKCITQWEPRVQLERVVDISTVSDTEHNTVKIEIIYSIPSLSPQQYSYIYEAQQAT